MFMDHVIYICVQTWQNNYDDVCVIALDHTRVISLSRSYFSDFMGEEGRCDCELGGFH